MSSTILSPLRNSYGALIGETLKAALAGFQALIPDVMSLPRNAVFIFSANPADQRVTRLRASLKRRTRLSPSTRVLYVGPTGVEDLATGEPFNADPTILTHIYDASNESFIAVANAAYAGRGKRLRSIMAIEKALFA